MNIEYWKKQGFTFEIKFPNEYDLWMNHKTMQKLRRYVDGREWLSNIVTGEYELIDERIKDRVVTISTKSKPSDNEYEKLRRQLMENTWGNQVKKCKHCGHPCIDGYCCQNCGSREP